MAFIPSLFYLLCWLRHGFVSAWLALYGWLVQGRYPAFYRKRQSLHDFWRVAPDKHVVRRSRAKPAWVKREVLRLAALTGEGCRTIEKLFNRLHAARDDMTVSKSFVHYTIRDHRYDIEVLSGNYPASRIGRRSSGHCLVDRRVYRFYGLSFIEAMPILHFG